MQIKMVCALIGALLVSGGALGQEQKRPSFYQDRERGWFWHESEIEPVEEEEVEEEIPVVLVEPSEPQDAKPDLVRLDVAWLRDNIDRLKIQAIENPNDIKNIAAYAYAQRLMLDMSTRFSTSMMDFMAMESLLDESQRRPTSTLSLNVFERETAYALSDTIKSLSDSTHIWFFYTSDCPYCLQQLPIVREFARRYELQVLAISLDGGILPGAETMETVFDLDLKVANMFDLQYTPTLVLAKSVDSLSDSDFIKLSEGLVTLPTLERTTLLAARDMGAITAEQYALTTEVREINVMRNEDGVLQAERELLENDPGYLAELLRERLREIARPVGATPYGDR